MAFFELHTFDMDGEMLSFSVHSGKLNIRHKDSSGSCRFSFTVSEPAKDFIEKLRRLEEVSSK